VIWFLYGSGALTVVVVRNGVAGFDAFRDTYLTVFVGAWIVQTLLGAWLYLLPVGTPAHPDERRGFLMGMEFAAAFQLAALNVGLALMVLHEAGWASNGVGTLGAGLAIVGGMMALIKAWLFVPLSHLSVATDRAREIWGA
jgi:hypothetical protein